MPFYVRVLVLPAFEFYAIETSFCKNSKTAKKRVFLTHNIEIGLQYEIFSNEPKMLPLVRKSSIKIFGLLLQPVADLLRFIRPKFGQIQNIVFKIQNLPNNFV